MSKSVMTAPPQQNCTCYSGCEAGWQSSHFGGDPLCLKVLDGEFPAPSVRDECAMLGGFIPDYFLYDPISTWKKVVTDGKLFSIDRHSGFL